jgi:SAM-dependent methyltransferase
VGVTELEEHLKVLSLADWSRPPDAGDHVLLDLCAGATLDIGCGPGRLTKALAERGHLALGIDVVGGVVGQAKARGATAAVLDVFAPLPGEGVWTTALLADGNIGIGGDPAALLGRARELVEEDGRVVVETEAPGSVSRSGVAVLEWEGRTRKIPWSVVALDDLVTIAARAGLRLDGSEAFDDRWFAVLARR